MNGDSDDLNIVGSCILMCPKREEAMRRKSDRLHYFEKKGIMVKEFLRVGAGNTVDPEDLRIPTVLVHTLSYLIKSIIPCNIRPYYEVYNFVFDRMRAIRQDLTVQRIEDDHAIQVYEVTSRFLVYSGYILCEEDRENYCQSTNTKHLNECLVKLHQLYKNQKEATREAEFVSCRLLTCLGSHEVILDVLSKKYLRSNATIRLVLEINFSFIRGNYVRVFKLSRNLPPLLACAFHLKLHHVRISFLKVMSAAYSVKNLNFPLDFLMKLMLYNEDAEKKMAVNMLESCGIDVVGNEVLFNNKKFAEPHSMDQHRNVWIDSLLQSVPNISGFLLGGQCGLSDRLEKLSL